MGDTEQPEFNHTAEDYAAFDGKDLPQSMVEDILHRTQLGVPLTAEQCDALGMSSKFEHVVLVPKDPKKMTKQQIYAMLGGEEVAKRKIEWFQWELMVINLEAMLKEGKTEHTNADGSTVPLEELLAIAKRQRDQASWHIGR